LALALGCIGGLAVLQLLGLQSHLALLHGLGLGSLLHGHLLSLLGVHARPKAARAIGGLFLATDAGGVDKVVRGTISREEHGWRHDGLLRLVEVHAHFGVNVDSRRPAVAEAAVHVHVDTRVEAVHHLRVHGQVVNASEREADLLLVLVVVVARSIEVLTLLRLVEGREGTPVLACRLRRDIRA
jgi:hypothetical protein